MKSPTSDLSAKPIHNRKITLSHEIPSGLPGALGTGATDFINNQVARKRLPPLCCGVSGLTRTVFVGILIQFGPFGGCVESSNFELEAANLNGISAGGCERSDPPLITKGF